MCDTIHTCLACCCLHPQILRNDDDGGEKGSLVWLLDSCATKFGGRLLRDWVVHPLVQHAAILERQDAVQQLLEAQQSGTDILKNLRS